MTTTVRPPFAYFGGKTTLGHRIAALLPAHRHYIEPYAGSLAVLSGYRERAVRRALLRLTPRRTARLHRTGRNERAQRYPHRSPVVQPNTPTP
jgi:hypothetical protein